MTVGPQTGQIMETAKNSAVDSWSTHTHSVYYVFFRKSGRSKDNITDRCYSFES